MTNSTAVVAYTPNRITPINFMMPPSQHSYCKPVFGLVAIIDAGSIPNRSPQSQADASSAVVDF
jgi:hypothetical protein